MDAAGWIAIAFLVVVVVLAWLYREKLKFKLKVPGFEASVEARGINSDPDKGRAAAESAQAAGDGAVAVGGDAENVDIETNVGKATQADTAPTEHSTGTASTGDGAVAIGGGAKGAKIRTNVTKGDVRK